MLNELKEKTNELLKNKSELVKQLVEASRQLASKSGDEEVVENNLLKDLKKMENAPTESVTTGSAVELVQAEITGDQIIENSVTNKRYAFLDSLSAGRVPLMAKTTNYTVEAEGDFFRMVTEWNSGALAHTAAAGNYKTAKVSIAAKRLYYDIDITDELLTFGVKNAMDRINMKYNDYLLKTVADIVLNADSNAGATGNINSDDQLASTTWGADSRLIGYNNSIRDVAIANSNVLSIGSPSNMNGIFSIAKLLPFDGSPSDRIIIMDNTTYYTYMGLDDFKDAAKNGNGSTITKGALTNIAGMDLFVTDVIRLSEADGKLSGVTPANNTKGTFAIVDKRAIQHGFFGDVRTNIDFNLKQGARFEATTYFGFDNLSNKNDGRVLCALGINVG